MSRDSKTPLDFLKLVAVSGTSASWAEFCTLPFDTAKVRLQIQGATKLAPGVKPYGGLLSCVRTMAVEEGPRSLWKGLVPGVMRQYVFGGLRIGFYGPVKSFYQRQLGTEGADSSFGVKVLAGLTSGAMAISIAQPTDLVKIRLQSEGSGGKPRYSGVGNAFATIAREEGVAGLWTGLKANIVRNSVINAAELASYDQLKQLVLQQGFEEGTPVHLSCGLGAGFIATVVGSPFDVVKTRLMSSQLGADGKPVYRGLIHCFGKMLRRVSFPSTRVSSRTSPGSDPGTPSCSSHSNSSLRSF